MNSMAITSTPRRVFGPLCLLISAAALNAQTAPTALSGDYILAEEGNSRNGQYASLSVLKLNAGSITGKQLVRTGAGMQWIDLQGSYTIDGTNIGSITLSSLSQDSEGNDVTSAMHYRFAISSTEIQAIRTDNGNLSTATMLPAMSGLTGSLVFSQLQNQDSTARVVVLNVDTLGNVTGTSIARELGSVTSTNVSGNYQMDNGAGMLTLMTQSTDDHGDVSVASQVFVVLTAKDRAVALRTDGGPIQLTTIAR
jgi:hypothetical protein